MGQPEPIRAAQAQSPDDDRTPDRTSTSGYLKVSVFLSGLAVMSAEMAAPRLLAPSFGTTQLIWTNIIGTVLTSLALGAFVGGRLADRWPAERAYARVLALSGVLLAVVPLSSRPLLARAAAALAEQQATSFLLSLAAVCVFFAPPVFLLGMIGPWAVRLAGIGRPDLGRIAGVLSGLGALGSILGTFLSSLVALPFLGTRFTLLAVSALLVVTGGWRAMGARGSRPLAVVFALVLVALPDWGVKSEPGQVYETESFYQYVQVKTDDAGWTRLYLNEGIGYQSVMPARGVLTGGVWDSMSALPVLVSRPGGDLRVLILGLAAGTVAHQIDFFYAADRNVVMDGVEIDGAVVDAGRRFFALDAIDTLRIHVADARPYLESAPGPYELIVVDAYKGFYVPFQLVTVEFFRAARDRLGASGILALNLATDPAATSLLDAFTATLRAVFPHVARFEVENQDVPFSNFVYLASSDVLRPPGPTHRPPGALRPVLERMRRAWTTPAAPPETAPFTDDRSPIEWLTDGVLLSVASR